MGNNARWLRWGLAASLLALSFVALLLGWAESCSTAVTEKAGAKETVTTCAPLGLDSGTLLIGILLVLALAWPDLSEVGAFGVSMKRKLEIAEEKAESAKADVASIGDRLELQALRIDNAIASVSTASASATVPIMIGDLDLSRSVQGLEAKIDAFVNGSFAPPPKNAESTATQDALRVELLENAEWLREAFPAVYGGGRRLQPDSRRISDADVKRRVGRFLSVFSEEYEIVRAARNAVAHAQPLTDDELRKAVEISRRLREAAAQAPGN